MTAPTGIMGIDMGTATGWAIRTRGNAIMGGTKRFINGPNDGPGYRFLAFRRWLTERHDTTGFAAVYYEEVRHHASTDAAHCYGAFYGCLVSWCEAKGIRYRGVNVATVKKSWTGSGGAKKERMIKVARERGFAPEDDNAADALAILHYALEVRHE